MQSSKLEQFPRPLGISPCGGDGYPNRRFEIKHESLRSSEHPGECSRYHATSLNGANRSDAQQLPAMWDMICAQKPVTLSPLGLAQHKAQQKKKKFTNYHSETQHECSSPGGGGK